MSERRNSLTKSSRRNGYVRSSSEMRPSLAIVDQRHGKEHNHERGDACSVSGGRILSDSAAESPAVIAGKGFAGNVLLVTLGCAKNLVDSELMLGAFRQKGFRPITEPEQADLIVVNTCAFLQSAVEEGIDRILELAAYKKEGRCRRLIVAGCMVERYRKDLETSFPEVDRFVSTDEIMSIADEGDGVSSDLAFDAARRPYFLYDETMPRIRSTAGHTAYLKVAEGCDRPCAFCIIPKIRGSFRSRPVQSIITEAGSLLGDGVRELNLVAQDLTAYGSDLGERRGSKLIELIDGFEGLVPQFGSNFWVRLLYAYPVGVNEELIRRMAESPVICKYLDLPLQHISNSVLKRMNRPLGERGTRGLIDQIVKTAPSLSLRTTFIVGFPGETDADVDALEEFVSSGAFTHVGVFPYSQESESKSFDFPDQVEPAVAEERRARIMEAQQRVVERRHGELIGSRMTVLVEGVHEDSDLLFTGRAAWQAPETDGVVILNDAAEELHTEGEASPAEQFVGKFVEVEITESAGYDLVGTILAPSE